MHAGPCDGADQNWLTGQDPLRPLRNDMSELAERTHDDANARALAAEIDLLGRLASLSAPTDRTAGPERRFIFDTFRHQIYF